jgi:glutaconate CoA-transferase subunit A
MSCERVVATEDLLAEGPVQTLRINRLMTDGVVESPGGAHFTSCVPDYPRDETFQRAYVEAAADADSWAGFSARYLELPTEADYQRVVREGQG